MTASRPILVVDDNTNACLAMVRILERAGFQTAQAASGEDAVRMAKEILPSLVLMDVVMPGISGIEALQKIHSDPVTVNIPVVLISSMRISPEQQTLGLDAGAAGYIARPVETIELVARVRMQMRQQEITEQLRTSEKRFRDLITHQADGVLVVDQSGAICFANPAAEKLLGRSAEELPGIVFGFPMEEAAPQQIHLIRPGKPAVDAEMHVAKTEWEGLPAWITTLHDVTDLRRTQEALRVSQESTRRKLEAILSPDGDISNLALADVLDKKAMQALMDDFFKITKIGVAMIDLDGQVLVSTGWQDICTKFHRIHPCTLQNCIESDTVLSKEIPVGEFKLYRCKNNMWDIATPIIVGNRHLGNLFLGQFFFQDEEPDREVFKLQAQKYGFDETAYLDAFDRVPRWDRSTVDTVMSFYSGLSTMISNLSMSAIRLARAAEIQKKAEGELRVANQMLEEQKQQAEALAQKAEAAARAKSDFLATMSHALRTPLNGVLGFAELLSDTDLSPEQEEFAKTISESGNHLLSVVNDILDFSSLEKGAMMLSDTPFSIAELVQTTILAVAKSAEDKGIACRFEIAEGVPAEMAGDERRTRQILLNLVGNAVKFTTEGKVELSVHLADDTACVEFAVRDTGPGIPKDLEPRLFQPFTQEDSTLSRKFQGTGLGLAISQRLAKLMGGSISLDRPAKKDSVFTLRLPLRPGVPPPTSPDAQTVAPASPQASARPVLVVEDDPVNAALTEKILTRLGFRAEVATSGPQAIEVFAEGKFSAILMDVRMPGMDGLEATKRIRSMEAASHLPIIALTANVIAGDREKCLESGMDDYLSKPFKMEELAAKLRRDHP